MESFAGFTGRIDNKTWHVLCLKRKENLAKERGEIGVQSCI